MATVQKIREGVFLISWEINNPDVIAAPIQMNIMDRMFIGFIANKTYQSVVNISEISLSCRLSFKKSINGVILGVNIDPITAATKDKNFRILKPSSILAIKNGVKQSMKLQNSTWTTIFSPLCACGERTAKCMLEILINFDLKTNSKRVLDHLFNLWETKTLADVTFKFNEKDVQAHSLIIASGSPVLAAMFQSDFKEKQEKVVAIKDIKSSVFEKMLRYIYTGDADLDNVDVADLLIAADKYGIDSLKEDCATYLARNITLDNVIRYLVISHLHESVNLRKSVLGFMAKNGETIVSRKDWLDFMKNYHELSSKAVQVMVSATKSKCSHSQKKKI